MEDNDYNPIKSLEALLDDDAAEDGRPNQTFEIMRSTFKDSLFLDESKDSGVVFPNLSFRLLPSTNTSFQNQSNESGFASESFDCKFLSKSLVNSISCDGCFIEDDQDESLFDCSVDSECKGNWMLSSIPKSGILSSAVSQGGLIASKPPFSKAVSVEEAFRIVSYTSQLRKCWKSICNVRELHRQLAQKVISLEFPPELTLFGLMGSLKVHVMRASEDIKSARLTPVLIEIMNVLDVMFVGVHAKTTDKKVLKCLQSVADNLCSALHYELAWQHAPTPCSKDQYRSKLRYQIWNRLM